MNQRPTSLQLQVSTRQIYRSDGKAIGEIRVFCPDRGHLMAAQECIECAQWSALHLEREGEGSFVRCAPRNQEPLRSGGRIAALMTSDLICLRPDLSVVDATDVLLSQHITAAPVVDREGKLLGIVSQADLLRAKRRSGEGDGSDVVEDFMTASVLAVLDRTSIGQAAALMVSEGAHRLVVLSPNGELVGVLSALDVMRGLAELQGYIKLERTGDDS